MTSDQQAKVYLGATNWRRPEWAGVFYPADMPDDWWLTYYNTQFSCVWLPHRDWENADIDAARQWHDDTHAGFRFVLERPPVLTEQAHALQEVLSDRLGIVGTAEDRRLVWFDAHVDLKQLTGLIAGRDKRAPTYLLSRDGDLATLEKVSTLLGLLGL